MTPDPHYTAFPLTLAFSLMAMSCASAQDDPPRFLARIEARFEAWDANGDGNLDPAETDDLVDDLAVTGPDAAALAALKQMQRNEKWDIGSPDRDYFKRYAEFAAANRGRAKPKKREEPEEGNEAPQAEFPDYDKLFNGALGRIKRANRDLFAPGAPDLKNFRQGRLGDCYFLAPIGAAVARDPAALRAMFAPQTDGSCTVTFPNGKKARLAPLTDTELALTSSTEGDGIWLNVLEKAFGTIRNEAKPEAKQKDSVTDLIAKGGSPTPVLKLLTGGEAKGMPLREKESRATPPSDEHVAAKLPVLRDGLKSAMKAKRLVCCVTPKEVATPGISPKHAYAVLGYDEAKDVVHVWNPHGNAFKPKGPAGLEKGYPTKDGHFTLPLDHFARIFSGVQFEQPAGVGEESGEVE